MAPRLAPGTPFERRPGSADEVRTVTRSTPHRPVSQYHRARWWLDHHLDRRDDGEWRDESGWGDSRALTCAAGGPRRAAGMTRAEQRADMRLAAHAQAIRAEASTMGGAEETRAYFGDENVAAADVRERRIRVSSLEADRARYESEAALRYGGRRARGEAALARYRRSAAR